VRYGALLFPLLLTVCAAAQDAADTLARDRAKTVIDRVVAERFPGVDAAPVTDCVIESASAQEIISVAQASVTGITDGTVETIVEISQRPETISCLASNALAIL